MGISAGIHCMPSPSPPVPQILPTLTYLAANTCRFPSRICRSSRAGPLTRSNLNKVISSSTISKCSLQSLECLFCYDKSIPEEIIGEPVGTSLAEREIGNNPRCVACAAKGVVLCSTCSGSGLYIDSILESQGILVKVRCLGCGGSGNNMCSECGGRGHV